MGRKTLPKGLKIAVALSLAAHVVVVAGVIFSGNTSRAKKPLQNVIATELVRLGKKRDEKLLPRKEAPPPEPEKTTPTPVVKPPEPTPAKPPPPKEAIPSAKDRLSQMSKVQNALDRLKQPEEEPEGEETGSQYGTVAKALAGNRFASEVYACIKANYTLEGITEAQAAALSADVLVRVDGKGKFIESDIERPSGNARFDQNVLRAARRCGQVSPPPPELAKQVRDDGILVKYGGR
jgi:TonB family protein